jgi:hypothetical protein
MSQPASDSEHQGFVNRNPGIVASVITVLVAVVFCAALYRTATSAHEEAPASHTAPAH